MADEGREAQKAGVRDAVAILTGQAIPDDVLGDYARLRMATVALASMCLALLDDWHALSGDPPEAVLRRVGLQFAER